MFFQKVGIHVGELSDSGHKHGHLPALLMSGVLAIQVLPVIFQKPRVGHMRQTILQGLVVQSAQSLDLRKSSRLAESHLQGDPGLLVCSNRGQSPVLRIFFCDFGQSKVLWHAICNHLGQPDNRLSDRSVIPDVVRSVQRHIKPLS